MSSAGKRIDKEKPPTRMKLIFDALGFLWGGILRGGKGSRFGSCAGTEKKGRRHMSRTASVSGQECDDDNHTKNKSPSVLRTTSAGL